jgi:hypothetical protein
MTPEEFVVALKEITRTGASSTADYFSNPPVPKPPQHMGEFTELWRALEPAQRDVLRDLMTYVAEGALFELLNVLDGINSLDNPDGSRLELRWIAPDGRTVLLNEPEGEFLYDIFNNTP